MTPTTVQPTQVQHPARAVARSIVQFLVVAAATVPAIVVAIGDDAPGWLAPILAGAVVLAGVVTRVMAIPAVNLWLGHVGLSAAPTGAWIAPADHDEPPSQLDRLDGLGRFQHAEGWMKPRSGGYAPTEPGPEPPLPPPPGPGSSVPPKR